MVPRCSEALWRRSGGDAEARTKHRNVCQHGGCAWVQGPGSYREHCVHAFERRRVWTPRATARVMRIRLPSVSKHRLHERADAACIIRDRRRVS